MTNLQSLALKRDEAYKEYDDLECKSRTLFNVPMAEIIQASNKAGSAFMAWHSELDSSGESHE